MAPNVTVHFWNANDINNASPILEITDEDEFFRGFKLTPDLFSLGGWELQLARKVGFALFDSGAVQPEVFVRFLIHAWSDNEYYFGGSLQKRNQVVVHREEQGEEVFTFGGPGPKSYMDRYRLGIEQITGTGWNLDLENGVWRWNETATAGRVLNRVVNEDASADDPALPDMSNTFSDTEDSNGDPWTNDVAGAGEYEIPIGQSLLETIYDLEDLSDLYTTINLGSVTEPLYRLNAYEAYGQDVSGGTFGAGVGLLREGVNIANDSLTVEGVGIRKATHVIVEGKDGAWATAVGTAWSSGEYVKWGKIEYTRSSNVNILERAGLRWIRRQDNGSKQITVEIVPGASQATGFYFPAPDGVIWPGNTITLDTAEDGSTHTPLDFNNEDQLVTGLDLTLGPAGDTATADKQAKSWDIKIRLNWERAGFAKSPDQTSAATGNGSCQCSKLCIANRQAAEGPGSPTVIFDWEAAGENAIVADWTPPDAEDVDEAFNRLHLGDAGSTNPGPISHSTTKFFSVYPSSNLGALASWSGDACIGGDGATLNSRRYGWSLLETSSGLVHLMDASTGSIGEAGWQLHITGHIKHPRATGGGGTYQPRYLKLEFFSDTNGGVKSQADTILVTSMPRGGDEAFDQTIDLDPDTQSFALISGSNSGEHWVLYDELFIEVIRPDDPGEILIEAIAGDGHPDLVGVGERTARCDHAHTVLRDAEPTVDDDLPLGYHVGTLWVVLDDLETPTEIVSVWFLVDNSAGAAVWLELPSGGGAAHAVEHEEGGADELEVSDLATSETDTDLVLHPDGTGGVEWGTDATGGGGGGEGFAVFGAPQGWSSQITLSGSHALAAVSGANGGALAVPVIVPGPMQAQGVSVICADTSLARSCEFRLYLDNGDSTADFVTGTDGTMSFTPSAVSRRSGAFSGVPVALDMGVYWLVIRNTHGTQAFSISRGSGVLAGLYASQTHTGIATLGSSIELRTSWTTQISVVHAWVDGRVLGLTAVLA